MELKIEELAGKSWREKYLVLASSKDFDKGEILLITFCSHIENYGYYLSAAIPDFQKWISTLYNKNVDFMIQNAEKRTDSCYLFTYAARLSSNLKKK